MGDLEAVTMTNGSPDADRPDADLVVAALMEAVRIRDERATSASQWRGLLNDLLGGQSTRCRQYVDAIVATFAGLGAAGADAAFIDQLRALEPADDDPPLAMFAATAWRRATGADAVAAPASDAAVEGKADVADSGGAIAAATALAATEPSGAADLIDASGSRSPGDLTPGDGAPVAAVGREPGDLTPRIPGDLSPVVATAGAPDVPPIPSSAPNGPGRRRAQLVAIAIAVLTLAVGGVALANRDSGTPSTTVETTSSSTSSSTSTTRDGGALVAVPNVVGMLPADASEQLDGAGLEATSGGTSCSKLSGIAEGEVNSQQPAWNDEVAEGTAVTLTVQECRVRVPRVVGSTSADALAALAQRGLVLGSTSTRCDSSAAGGVVLSQRPLAGSEADPGDAVSITINDCPTGSSSSTSSSTSTTDQPSTVTVPSVTGLSYDGAANRLADDGLGISISDTFCDTTPGHPADNTVIDQNPNAGTVVELGSTVGVTLQDCPDQ
jgi:beta-lactam-binding protein with PASTA domain